MEQITRRDGIVYYGEQRCESIDDAYCRFRSDYHRGLGKEVYQRLDRLGQRVERIHGHGFVFAGGNSFGDKFKPLGRTKCRIMGLVGISYVRVIGLWDYPELQEEEFEQWLDWVYARGSGALRTVGTRDKVGRTSKRLKTRYR